MGSVRRVARALVGELIGAPDALTISAASARESATLATHQARRPRRQQRKIWRRAEKLPACSALAAFGNSSCTRHWLVWVHCVSCAANRSVAPRRCDDSKHGLQVSSRCNARVSGPPRVGRRRSDLGHGCAGGRVVDEARERTARAIAALAAVFDVSEQ